MEFRQVHLDFHTSEAISGVGEDFDSENFAETLQKAEVELVNVFAKCHHGMLYYDTLSEARHPNLKFDILGEQLKACKKYGIKTQVYFSVCYDEFIAKRKEEWWERDENGTPTQGKPFEAVWKKLCLGTEYVDYLESQVQEVIDKYSEYIHGIWFDIVDQVSCCCYNCTKGMKELGLNPINEKERKFYGKNVTDNFKERMSAFVRSRIPESTIFYNSGHISVDIRKSMSNYSHLEIESLPSGGWGYEHFPVTAKFVKNLGMEYVGMTGRFHKSWADFGGYKNPASLEYECLTVLAEGGTCCIGDQLHPRGEINSTTYRLIGDAFRKIKSIEDWCANVTGIAEIGVYTTEALNGGSRCIANEVKGAYRMLSETQYQFDIVDNFSDFGKYKVLIFPDEIYFNDELTNMVKDFIDRGGKVLLSNISGMNWNSKDFALKSFGIEYVGKSDYTTDYIQVDTEIFSNAEKVRYVMYDSGAYVKSTGIGNSIGTIWNPYFERTFDHFCSHYQCPDDSESQYPAIVETDSSIYFSHPIFAMYAQHGNIIYKKLVINAIDRLLGKTKIVKSNLPSSARVVLNHQIKKERYVMHVLHYIPEKRCDEIEVIEDIIPLHDCQFEVIIPELVSKVYLAPSMKELEYELKEGKIIFTVDKIVGNALVVFDI